MVVRVVYCQRCGGKIMAGSTCSRCANDVKTGEIGKSRLSKNKPPPAKGPIIAFAFVSIGLYLWAEFLLTTKGPTLGLFPPIGAVIIMSLWKIGYWHEDGESVFGYFAARWFLMETLGFFLSPSKIVWFWTTERPYFRACTIASWLALIIFYITNYKHYLTT